MMIIEWILVIASCAAFFAATGVYIHIRSTGNKLLAIASKEFHEACDSLLKTPDDLPDRVLKAIENMSKSAFQPRSHWHFLHSITSKKLDHASAEHATELRKQIDEMRPELRNLMMHAIVSWMNMVSNRNAFVAFRIGLEVRNAEARRGKLDYEAKDTAMRFLPNLFNGGADCGPKRA